MEVIIIKLLLVLFFSFNVEAELPEPIWKWIQIAECGTYKQGKRYSPPCCHWDKNDPGGVTCVGISIRANADVMGRIITNSFRKCSTTPIATIKGPQRYRVGCKEHFPAKKEIMDVYYHKYYKQFEKCPFKIALQITDSKILSGQGVRLFQRSQGLKADNIWGAKTEAVCQNNPDMKAFKKERLERLKRIKNRKGEYLWDFYGNGWSKRLNNLDEHVKKI